MKKFWVLILLFGFLKTQAQESPSKLSISYFGLHAIKPGVKIGYEINPGQLTLGKKALFILPQVAWYTEPDNFNDLLFNFELSQHIGKLGNKSYLSYGLALGYINQSKLQSFSQNLGSSGRENIQRTTNHFFHPSANFAWHKILSERSNLFFKYTIGNKFSGNAPNELTMFIEAGIELSLKR